MTFHETGDYLLRAVASDGSMFSYENLGITVTPVTLPRMGRANATNPIALVVPCHRVIGADGKLTGYAGGMDRKQALLELEGALEKSA